MRIVSQTKHITFDGLTDEYGAKHDPALFIDNFPPPIILDEIQYCPELLSLIKKQVDRLNQKGLYLLTGSQNLSSIKNTAESMAGRVGIIQLDSLSISEIAGETQCFLKNYLESPESLANNYIDNLNLDKTLYELMWQGGIPDCMTLDSDLRSDYFASYMQTYIERDVRLLENIQDISAFERFVRITGALTSQEINYTQIGREIGINRATAHKWLDVLVSTYQWNEVPPYHGNSIKKITKKPKGYIQDTGLACYLQRISSPDAIASHPLRGPLFETFIAGNILKESRSTQTPPYVYHWRTRTGTEVDLVLERDGKLYPIEIKCKSQVTKHDTRGIQAFRSEYSNAMPGVVIYAGNTCYKLNEHAYAVPWHAKFIQPALKSIP